MRQVKVKSCPLPTPQPPHHDFFPETYEHLLLALAEHLIMNRYTEAN